MSASIHYNDGFDIKNPVAQIWDDWHTERAGMFRAFWCASPAADHGSPVIGYCSPGGSHSTIRAVAREVWHYYPDVEVYCNGRRLTRALRRAR